MVRPRNNAAWSFRISLQAAFGTPHETGGRPQGAIKQASLGSVDAHLRQVPTGTASVSAIEQMRPPEAGTFLGGGARFGARQTLEGRDENPIVHRSEFPQPERQPPVPIIGETASSLRLV